jgi:hypothetical protein
MAIGLNDNIFTNAPKPSDDRYGPFATLAAAITGVPSAVRYIGLTVGVGSPVAEYWFKNGLTDSDLIAKIPDTFVYRHDYVTPYSYIGKAVAGSVDSSTVWKITRLTISDSGTVTETKYAINVNWTDYLTHTYA